MLRRFTVMLVAVIALLGSSLALAQSDEPTVATSDTPELGTFLTDAEGRTLYMFTRDEPGTSNCSGDCLANWPAFAAEEPLTLPDGVPGELTQITREDGSQQVAYNDMPLYYYAADTAAGDTTGQGVGDVWFVVTPAPAGFQIATPIGSPAASPVASPAATPAG
ncbi:MAG TPA: hypothetical protein VGR08_10710 [Thermomicrobiales bacterium]|nr:hypothetical protein [Thermomicrobiales bacterium]